MFIRFAIILIILEVIIFVGIIQFYDTHKKDLILAQENELLKTLRNQIVFSLDRVESDLNFLGHYIEDEYNNNENFKYNVSLKLSMFASAKMIYDQIRILDISGQEWIRLNLKNNQGVLVPDDMLQDKSDRYYYKNSINLGQNSIFVSPLDLNIENGQIELPYKAMLRFAKPLFDSNGNKFGVLVLNYLADTLLREFKQESQASSGKIFLTNSEGYYFVGPNSEDEWGFMFPKKHKNSLKYQLPEVWDFAAISDRNQGILEDGLVTHTNIQYIAKNQSNSSLLISDSEKENYASKTNSWHLVSFVDNDAVSASLIPIEQRASIILLVIFLALSPILYLLARNISIKKAAIKRLVDNQAELSELNQMKDKLFSIIAHDLRNPMQVLILSSELLKVHYEKKYFEKMEKDIYKLINTTNSFKDLLESLLSWSRSQAGKVPFEKRPFNIAEICKKSIDVCKGSAEMKEIALETENCIDFEVNADPHMISTVFQNLIFNAIKFTPIGGKIVIQFKNHKNHIEISVNDNGVGMSQEEIRDILKIDQHFTKRGTEGEAGSGIGILLCKEFIEKHDGVFDIESELGVGSTFKFTIPKIKYRSESKVVEVDDSYSASRN